MVNRKLIMILIIILLFPMVGYCKSVKAPIAKKKIVVNSRVNKDRSKCGSNNQRAITRVIKLNASAYTLSKTETDGDPFITATGERPIPGKTCAVSRDLKHLMNKRIYLVSERRVLYINDTMHGRYRKSIDIVMNTKGNALRFGKKDVIVVVLN